MNPDFNSDQSSSAWEEDCLHWHGRILTGRYSHWCYDWDELPVDETCMEFANDTCFDSTPEIEVIKVKLYEDSAAEEAAHELGG